PDVYTGVGGETVNTLKRLGSTLLGIEGIEGVADAEAANRVRDAMFAGFRQEMLSGATSNSDREFIRAIPPNITDSAEGIQLLIEMQRKASDAAQLRAELLQDIVDRSPDG